MSGETNVAVLLKNLTPEWRAGEYVFCTVREGGGFADGEAVAFFREAEGVTVVLPRGRAKELGLPCSRAMAWITLMVYSSLEAVGLTAAVATALAAAGISCNVMAAYYHDHLFVPVEEAERAMLILHRLGEEGVQREVGTLPEPNGSGRVSV